MTVWFARSGQRKEKTEGIEIGAFSPKRESQPGAATAPKTHHLRTTMQRLVIQSDGPKTGTFYGTGTYIMNELCIKTHKIIACKPC